MIEDKDYKDVVVDNDAIVNTPAEELPDEPYNIPQGKEPHLNPNPGYGDDGETKPAIKTDLVEGERGTPVIENTPPKESPEKIFNGEVVFNVEPIIKGQKLTDFIDKEGGVTQEELEQGLAGKQDVLEDAPEGSAVKIVGLDSEGNVVQDDIPEGIVVDETIIEDSPNAVAGGAVYDALQEVDAELDTKANTSDLENGTVVVAKSLTAKDLENVSDESGTYQDSAFISQGTGTDNNTSSVDTGDVAKQIEKQGNTFVKNQLVQNGNFASDTNWTLIDSGSVSKSIANNTLTLTSSSASKPVVQYGVQQNINILKDHKYLVSVYCKGAFVSADQRSVYVYFDNSYTLIGYSTSSKTHFFAIITATANASVVKLAANLAEVGDSVDFNDFNITELKQWFNDDIPQDLLDHPSHWSWYQNYGDYIAYNIGELVDSEGQYLVCTGRQQWDEVAEQGAINSSGQNTSGTTEIRSKNYIRVIPNRDYYLYMGSGSAIIVYFYDKDKTFIKSIAKVPNTTFTALENATYIRIATNGYGGTYKHDITISLYYTPEQGGEGYSEYYPYVAPKVYDTGSETLLAFDKKLPSGEILHNTGTITVELTYNSDLGLFKTSTKVPNANRGANFICNKGYTNSGYVSQGNMPEKTVQIVNTDIYGVWLKDSSLDTSSTITITLQYAFNNNGKTTEQGTPFAENIEINDYGMMYWLDADNNLVDIPQGVKVFYPAWYAGFTDSLFARTNGDASDVVIQSEIDDTALATRGYYKQEDLSEQVTVNVNKLTATRKLLKKCGNVMTLSFVASITDEIAAGTGLLQLPSSAFNSGDTTSYLFNIVKNVSGTRTTVIGTIIYTGDFALYETLNAGDVVNINVSWIISE